MTRRQNKLYDLADHSYDWRGKTDGNGVVTIDKYVYLDWDDLPVAAQWAIITKARRRYAIDLDLDPNKWQFNLEDEKLAYGIMERENLRSMKLNAMNSPHTSAVMAGVGGYSRMDFNPLGERDG